MQDSKITWILDMGSDGQNHVKNHSLFSSLSSYFAWYQSNHWSIIGLQPFILIFRLLQIEYSWLYFTSSEWVITVSTLFWSSLSSTNTITEGLSVDQQRRYQFGYECEANLIPNKDILVLVLSFFYGYEFQSHPIQTTAAAYECP